METGGLATHDEAKGILGELLLGCRKLEEMKHAAGGLNGPFDNLKYALTHMEAFIFTVECSIVHLAKLDNRTLIQWLKRVKIAAQIADDVMDDWAFESRRRRLELSKSLTKRFFTFSYFTSLLFDLRMRGEIRLLISSFADMHKDGEIDYLRRRLTTAARTINDDDEGWEDITRQYAAIRGGSSSPVLLGRQHDAATIIQMLLCCPDAESNPSVIAIAGMQGIGKTALANHIYQNEATMRHFSKRVWICASNYDNEQALLAKIFASLGYCRNHMVNTDTIVQEIQQHLNGGTYLLVLDNIWYSFTNVWDTLREALGRIGGLPGSKVLVTSRSYRVVAALGAPFIYHLDGLSDKESWALFQQRAFLTDVKPAHSSGYEVIARRIVNQCSGNPLAIEIAGHMLMLGPSRPRSEWKRYKNSELWEIWQDIDGILPLLAAFNKLPSFFVKKCLTYCSIFQEGTIIKKFDMINLWLAQDFLRRPIGDEKTEDFLDHLDGDWSLEDIGEKYLQIFLDSFFFQVSKKNEIGDVIEYTVPSLVHQLAFFISRHDWLISKGTTVTDTCDSVGHMAIFDDYDMEASKLPPKLRTLHSWTTLPKDLLTRLRCLRVLKLNGIGLTEVPSAIDGMKHLRYLDLSGNPINELPEFVTRLNNLQTLKLLDCTETLEFPKGLSNLVNLRHIQTGGCMNLSSGLGHLVKLRTLPSLELHESGGWTIDELGGLRHIWYLLSLHSLEHVKSKDQARRADIRLKQRLKALELYWTAERLNDSDCLDEDVLDALQPHLNLKRLKVVGFNGVKFPSWLSLSSNLVKIELIDCKRCRIIPTLGQLPLLRDLIISGMDCLQHIRKEFYTTSTKSREKVVPLFPGLKMLEIRNVPELKEWFSPPNQSGKEAFLCLETLNIIDCPQLTTVPKVFPSLKHVHIERIKGREQLNVVTESCNKNKLTSLALISISELTRLPPELSECSSLENLAIQNCAQLMSVPDGIQNLGSLKAMYLDNCTSLVSLPGMAGLRSLRVLVIRRCKELKQGLSGLECCRSLERLSITECPNLQAIPDLRHLNLLEELDIQDYKDLSALLEGVYSLPRLRALRIGGLRVDREHLPDISHLTSLNILWLKGWPRLKSLAYQVQCLSRLRVLKIWCFDDLERVPEWIGNLPSLEYLILSVCKILEYLPSKKAISRLKRLYIEYCPLLEERCQNDYRSRETISRVPLVKINGKLWSFDPLSVCQERVPE